MFYGHTFTFLCIINHILFIRITPAITANCYTFDFQLISCQVLIQYLIVDVVEQVKPKRTYIRTKLAKDKPVDMQKLAVPFEYGWRRETRLRGINKQGKMVGEVFYYTPTDKRMRSYNDVQKYLNQLKENHKRSSEQVEPAKSDESVADIGDCPPSTKQHNTSKL